MKIPNSYLAGRAAAFLLLSFATACGSSGDGASATGPTVLSISPLTDATDVPANSTVSATFSEAMDPASFTASTFMLKSGAMSVPVPGTVTYSDRTAEFHPTVALDGDDTFTATITTACRSASGEAVAANRSWTFRTGGKNSPPRVVAVAPLDGATGVAQDGTVRAAFSRAMDPASLDATTFTLTSGGTAIPGTVTYAGTTAVFTPGALLDADRPYTATITTGARSSSGVALLASRSWSFTTGPSMPKGLPVMLGSSGNFVILAKSGISTVPTSAITGNVGVSPAAATAITGFALIADASNVFSTSSQVVGKVYAADYAPPSPSSLTTAVGDMELAFTDAAGRAPDVTELGAGNIGGMTLAPGVYKWGTGLLIPTDVTLSGSSTDVWIFEIAQDLTVSSGARVLLSGGALPRNVFWQVSGMAALGTTAHLEGVVLSQTAATLATGASINGRLLSQTAVTLDGSTVVEPTP